MNNRFSHIFYRAITPFIGVFAVLMNLCAHAQDTLTNKVQQLNDMVVTGQYGDNSLKQSVYKVRVIEAKRMQMQGAFNLQAVLSNELNIRISQDPVLGSSMSLQGVTGQNIKLLVDGVPVIGREGGNIDLTQLNMNNVERIEVVEGPMSVNFGTDALGGVINIITKKTKSNTISAGAETYYESIGQYNASLRTGLANKKWSMQLSGGRNFFEGYSLNNNSRVKLWKPREQYLADVNFGRQLKKGSIRLNNSFFNEKVTNRDSGVITWESALAQDQYYYTRRLGSALFFEHKAGAHGHVNIVASYSNYRRIRRSVVKDLVSLQETVSADPTLQDTSYFNLWMSRGTYTNNDAGRKISYQAGYEVNSEMNSGSHLGGTSPSITDYNAFGSAEIKLGRFLLRPGLRVIYNTKFDAPLVPSFNVKYDIGSHLIARASYGRGFRAPSLKELYLSFVDPSHNIHGNPDLKAETGDNVQASLQYEYQHAEKVFRVEPSVFYNHIRNMIDLPILNLLTLEAQYMNINSFQSKGMNLNTEFRTPAYSVALGYSYTGRNSTLMQSAATDRFFYSNELRANSSYKFRKAGLTFAVFYKYNGRLQNYQFDYVNNVISLGYINPYHTFDASATKELFAGKLSLTAGVKNILNTVNVAANMSTGVHGTGTTSAMVGMGRTFFISCRYTFERRGK